MRRLLLTPRWVGLTALMIVLVIGFCLLGWWQAQRALVDGNARSFGYAFEWPVFAIMVIVMYVKTLRDELRGGPSGKDMLLPRRAHATKRGFGDDNGRLVSLAVRENHANQPDDSDDEELAAYNRYLAQRSGQAARRV